MSLLKNKMELVYVFLLIILGLKIQDGCQNLDKDNRFWYHINWCVILISGLNLLRQGVL